MSDIIRRKLDEAKKQLSQIENKVNAPEPEVRKTRTVSPPVPEPITDGDKRDAPSRVGYAIEAGPRMRKRWKEV